MSRASRRDYFQRIYPRCRGATRAEKRRRQSGRTYGPRIMSIVKEVWETADYPWSVRLKALLEDWMLRIRARYRLTAAAV